jgi:hypothetical protein
LPLLTPGVHARRWLMLPGQLCILPLPAIDGPVLMLPAASSSMAGPGGWSITRRLLRVVALQRQQNGNGKSRQA